MFGGLNIQSKRLHLLTLAFVVLFASCASIKAQAQDITTGLISHWKLNETAGAIATDSGSLNNAGAYQNGLAPATHAEAGKIGGGLNFSNVNNHHILAPSNAAYIAMKDLTFSAWVKPTTFTDYQGIIDIQDLGILHLNFNSNNIIFAADAWNTQAGSWSAATILATDEWAHIAVTYSYNDPIGTKPIIYVNGTALAAPAEAFAPTGAYIAPADGSVIIGNADISSLTRSFNGVMDDARIYNRVLSATDINALATTFPEAIPCNASYAGVIIYNNIENVLQYCNATDWIDMGAKGTGGAGTCSRPAGVRGEVDYNFTQGVMQYCNGADWIAMGPHIEQYALAANVPTTNLIGYWPLDETSGALINDSIGSNDGTWTDNADNDVTGETTTGKNGTAITFDGVDDEINFGSDASLDNLSPMTVCAWVNPSALPNAKPNIFDKSSNGADGWNFYLVSTGSGFGFYTNERGWKEHAGNSISLNTWQHICGTWDGTDGVAGINLYLNGVLKTTVTSGDQGATLDDSGFDLKLGHAGTTAYRFAGSIDDARIYDRELSNPEIFRMYVGTGAGGETPSGCPSIGDVCSDGSVHTGLTADGNVPMYTTRCDMGQSWDGAACTGARTTTNWNNGNTAGFVATGTTNDTTGAANTATIIATDSDNDVGGTQPHLAAQYCADLVENGHNDWYLPSETELVIMNTNKALIGNFISTPGSNYWTSREHGSIDNVYAMNFSSNIITVAAKESLHYLRCTRTGAGSSLGSCSNPTGVRGEMVYNADNTIMQYCNGIRWIGIR